MDGLIVGLVAAFAISLGWGAFSVWLGPALHWVDLPDRQPGLSVHKRPAVPLGGVGIFLAVHVALTLTDRYDGGLALATGIALLLGLADDRVDLAPKLRLVVEVLAGLVLMTQGNVGVDGWWDVVVGTVLVVVAINAINLFDGLDGLVATSAIVTALGVAWLADSHFAPAGDGRFGLVVAAAIAGFLVLNWNPAKVFLGDNGAYTVAILLSYGILQTVDRTGVVGSAASEAPNISIWIPMGLLGVFILDLAVTLLRRRLNRRPMFEGDRSHMYDQLVDRGLSVKQVALMAAGAQAAIVMVVAGADRWLGGLPALIVLYAVLAALLGGARQAGFLRVDP